MFLVGTIGLVEVKLRQPTGVHSATVVRTHGYRVRHERYIYNAIVELESGGLVRLREVPNLEPGTLVLAAETVSPIFRIKRYEFVPGAEPSSP